MWFCDLSLFDEVLILIPTLALINQLQTLWHPLPWKVNMRHWLSCEVQCSRKYRIYLMQVLITSKKDLSLNPCHFLVYEHYSVCSVIIKTYIYLKGINSKVFPICLYLDNSCSVTAMWNCFELYCLAAKSFKYWKQVFNMLTLTDPSNR